MAIPAFDSNQLLPPGTFIGEWADRRVYLPHLCDDVADMETQLVGKFPDSITRPTLFREVQRFLAVARERLKCFELHVSGEFVTGKQNPDTVLLVLDVVATDLTDVDSETIWLLHRVFGAEFTFGPEDAPLIVETRFIRTWPQDHINAEGGNYDRLLALMKASHPIPDTEAGYVAVVECEGRWADVAAIFQTAASGN